MKLLLTSTSKKYSDLKYFSSFLQNNSLSRKNVLILVHGKIKKEVKTWTLLKSPHVNNTAKEQFSSNTHLLRYAIQVDSLSRFALFYKEVVAKLFCHVSTEVSIVSPPFTASTAKSSTILQTSQAHLKEYDVYGETCFTYPHTKTSLPAKLELPKMKATFQILQK